MHEYEWTMAVTWPGTDTSFKHRGTVLVAPGTAEETVRDDCFKQLLQATPDKDPAEAAIVDFTLTYGGVAGRKFHLCFCGAWIGVEVDGPFSGKLAHHQDDESGSWCDGSWTTATGPGRNWFDGHAPGRLGGVR